MEQAEDNELSQLGDLVNIEIGRREKRPMCAVCSRPLAVCWCKSLNGKTVSTKCKIILLQHPHEEKRCLRTAPILEALIPEGNYVELKGKRFTPTRFPQLKEIFKSKNSIVLYPGVKALNVDELPPVSETQAPYNILILDGTWQQAKAIFNRNTFLKDLRQVCLSGRHISQYVIRTQPTEDALSTVETAAIVLSTLEKDWSIYSLLIQPLKVMCEYQMNHGAVKHHSKEYLILSGNYKKPMGKKTFKKLKKCGVKNTDVGGEEEQITECQEQNGDSDHIFNNNNRHDTKLNYLHSNELCSEENYCLASPILSFSKSVDNILTSKVVVCDDIR